MKSQIGYLRVVVPPDIIDQESSNDVTVVEGANVTLRCKARGYPQPEIEVRHSLLYYTVSLLMFGNYPSSGDEKMETKFRWVNETEIE